MNTRLRLLALLTTCALLSAGTWHFLGRQERNEDKSPLQPTTRTTQELLIGTWKVTAINNQIAKAHNSITIQFLQNGALVIDADGPEQPPATTGTYKLYGNTLSLTSRSPEDGNIERTRIVTIEIISETELVTVLKGFCDAERERMVFKRLANR